MDQSDWAKWIRHEKVDHWATWTQDQSEWARWTQDKKVDLLAIWTRDRSDWARWTRHEKVDKRNKNGHNDANEIVKRYLQKNGRIEIEGAEQGRVSEIVALASQAAVYDARDARMQVSFGGNECALRAIRAGK